MLGIFDRFTHWSTHRWFPYPLRFFHLSRVHLNYEHGRYFGEACLITLSAYSAINFFTGLRHYFRFAKSIRAVRPGSGSFGCAGTPGRHDARNDVSNIITQRGLCGDTSSGMLIGKCLIVWRHHDDKLTIAHKTPLNLLRGIQQVHCTMIYDHDQSWSRSMMFVKNLSWPLTYFYDIFVHY